MSYEISDKSSVKILVQVLIAKGLKEVVISPGSRNAPLILSFSSIPEIKCFTIVDERSAGFFALGMAQQLQRPVALLCTSGTAALNYAPAIAEAYYQEVPLVVLTADRPAEWLGQADGQTIPQQGLYQNYVRFQANLPVEAILQDDHWYVKRLVSEAFNRANGNVAGPVHINVPLREPLYNKGELKLGSYNTIDVVEPSSALSEENLHALAQQWSHAKKVMVVCGVCHPNEELNKAINVLSQQPNTVFLTETTSNIKGDNIVECIDRQVFSIEEDKAVDYSPELLISFGGQIVSKQIKKFLRNNAPQNHWHISLNEEVIDTFQHLSLAVKVTPEMFFLQMAGCVQSQDSDYRDLWMGLSVKNRLLHLDYCNDVEWSDFKALSHIFTNLPQNINLQLANSTPVRYAQLFQDEIHEDTFANRGTSGIDGSTSTAVGAAYVSQKATLLITGDMSFFYDSNGLWNKYLRKDFKIVLINNGGGGIFRFIPGPSQTEELEEFFEAKHNQSAKYIAKAFGLRYYSCSGEDELRTVYNEFLLENEQASILEVFTPGDLNGEILRNYFKSLVFKI